MIPNQLGGRRARSRDNLLPGRNRTDVDARALVLDRGIEAILPVLPLAQHPCLLFEIVRGIHDIRPRPKSVASLFARLVAINLSSDNNIADRNVLDAASYANEQRHVWLVMPEGAHRDSCGAN